MILSIIIPVYNEEKTIGVLLQKLQLVAFGEITTETIVVNDGSNDKTAKTISSRHARQILAENFKIVTHKKNRGKGAAIKSGIRIATGDYIVIQDADLEYDPGDIPRLLKPIIQGKANVVYGTRLRRMPNFKRDERTVTFFVHYMGNKVLSLLTSLLYGQWITDMETGYKIFPKSVFNDLHIRSNKFDFEAEITAKLLNRKYKIVEIPISTIPRSHKDGKKLRTIHDGMAALLALIKYRFVEV